MKYISRSVLNGHDKNEVYIPRQVSSINSIGNNPTKIWILVILFIFTSVNHFLKLDLSAKLQKLIWKKSK